VRARTPRKGDVFVQGSYPTRAMLEHSTREFTRKWVEIHHFGVPPRPHWRCGRCPRAVQRAATTRGARRRIVEFSPCGASSRQLVRAGSSSARGITINTSRPASAAATASSWPRRKESKPKCSRSAAVEVDHSGDRQWRLGPRWHPPAAGRSATSRAPLRLRSAGARTPARLTASQVRGGNRVGLCVSPSAQSYVRGSGASGACTSGGWASTARRGSCWR
jgi:hypothetical protein